MCGPFFRYLCRINSCTDKTRICRSALELLECNALFLYKVLFYISLPSRYLVKVTQERTDRGKRLAKKGRIPNFSKKETHILS